MLVQVLLIVAGSCVLGVVASMVMTRASDRPPAWNIAFGALVGIAVLLVVAAVAVLLTQAAFGA